MPLDTVSIPFDQPRFRNLPLVYLYRDSSYVFYLQMVRQPDRYDAQKLEDWRTNYEQCLPSYLIKFAGHFDDEMGAIVSPPSSRPRLLDPYRAALLKKFPRALDLTDAFTDTSKPSSGLGTSFEHLVTAISYKPLGNEPALKSLVIVDDVLASGRTAAAVIQKLTDAGLPQNCQITVACALWVRDKN
jgi:predicted amidophosphoribosyltransferase